MENNQTAHLKEWDEMEDICEKTKKACKLENRKKLTKFGGTLAVEMLRELLKRKKIHFSHRNVFIRGIPSEIDLLILRRTVTPSWNMLYDPSDVKYALEVKKSGSFGKGTIEKVKALFSTIRRINPKICCAYVAWGERRNYKDSVTSKILGFKDKAYTFVHYGSKYEKYEPTGELEQFLRDVSK